MCVEASVLSGFFYQIVSRCQQSPLSWADTCPALREQVVITPDSVSSQLGVVVIGVGSLAARTGAGGNRPDRCGIGEPGERLGVPEARIFGVRQWRRVYHGMRSQRHRVLAAVASCPHDDSRRERFGNTCEYLSGSAWQPGHRVKRRPTESTRRFLVRVSGRREARFLQRPLHPLPLPDRPEQPAVVLGGTVADLEFVDSPRTCSLFGRDVGISSIQFRVDCQQPGERRGVAPGVINGAVGMEVAAAPLFRPVATV